MVAQTRNRRWTEVLKDNIPLERLAEHFEAFNKSEAKSPRKVEWYSRVIGYFTAYLKAQGCSTQLDGVDVHAVREFILYLQNRTRWTDHPPSPAPSAIWPPSAFRTMSGPEVDSLCAPMILFEGNST